MSEYKSAQDSATRPFKLQRRRESVSAEEVLKWMKDRPGGSWTATILDIERALDEIAPR